MPAAARSWNEAERQSALLALNIVGTDRSIEFDIYPELASQLFSTPIAAISLVDEHRQWFKASVGLDISEIRRDASFCAHAILHPEQVLYVPDATRDPRFADNPLVTGDFGLRFYAAAPIIGPSGHVLGTLCVIDREPRTASPHALEQLKKLALGVGSALKLHGAGETLRKRDTDNSLMQTMLASVFQKIDAAVVIVRSTGVILLGNPGFQALIGYSAEELPGITVRDLILREHQPAAAAAHARQFATGEPFQMELVTLAKDGRHIHVHLTSAVVQRADKQLFRVVTLRELVKPPPQVAARTSTVAVLGCIQLLHLEPIKAAYGPRWGGVRSRLLLAAEKVLKRRLATEDIFSRTADDGFSIWFNEGTEEENAPRVTRIGREIRVMLLGELGDDTNCAVASYTEVAEVTDLTATPAVIMEGLTQRVMERRGETEQQSRDVLKLVTQRRPRELTPVCDSAGQAIGSQIDLPRAIRSRFAAAMSLVGGPTADADTELLRLGLAVDAIMDDLAQKRNGLYFITLTASLLLGDLGRDRFLAQWRTFAKPVGARLFVLLSEIPPDVNQARLAEIAGLLETMTSGVGVLLENIDALPFTPQSCPFSTIGLASEHFQSTPETRLRAFFLKLHQINGRVLIRLKPGEAAWRWHTLGADLTTQA